MRDLGGRSDDRAVVIDPSAGYKVCFLSTFLVPHTCQRLNLSAILPTTLLIPERRSIAVFLCSGATPTRLTLYDSGTM